MYEPAIDLGFACVPSSNLFLVYYHLRRPELSTITSPTLSPQTPRFRSFSMVSFDVDHVLSLMTVREKVGMLAGMKLSSQDT
jgi:hypothetical protein